MNTLFILPNDREQNSKQMIGCDFDRERCLREQNFIQKCPLYMALNIFCETVSRKDDILAI